MSSPAFLFPVTENEDSFFTAFVKLPDKIMNRFYFKYLK